MDGSATDVIQNSSEGGISASHPKAQALPVLVGPSTGGEKNRATVGLIPVACWRVHDIRFAFGSSFLKPEVASEIKKLAALRQKHALKTDAGLTLYPPASIFGHADPVNTDAYNKVLSGRRSTSIYALLTRDTRLWEYLHSKHEGGDDWGTPCIIVMLQTLGFALGSGPGEDPETKRAIREFQAARGLAVDGVAGPKTRARLFREYMDALCGADFQLDKQDDFLAGTDPGGKGDYQGCSEFNPVLLFSQQEEAEFSKPSNKEQRNAENAPNRRVMILLFRPGSRVTAAKWPCPRAREGVEGCKKRFWSDGERRRTERLASERRLFENTKDTFGCRFYQRLTDRSPCERAALIALHTVDIYFDIPSVAPALGDRFRLFSDDGSYDRILDRSAGVPHGESQMLLRYTDVPTGPMFTLMQVSDDGIKLVVFSGARFEEIDDFGPPTPEPKSWTAERPQPDPPLILTSGDPSLTPVEPDFSGSPDDDGGGTATV